MKLKNGTQSDLWGALERINIKYQGNIEFNRLDGNNFTLKVKNSGGPGHTYGHYPNKKGNLRKLTSACWHVHGDFFDALFEINPEAVIYSAGRKITINGGNWIDWNVGSIMYPLYYSENCDCGG